MAGAVKHGFLLTERGHTQKSGRDLFEQSLSRKILKQTKWQYSFTFEWNTLKQRGEKE